MVRKKTSSRVEKFRSAHFRNREQSWLRFNARVLEEAERRSNPLLERLKFLTIASSNLDEFFEVRVAGLEQKKDSRISSVDISGYTPASSLRRIYSVIRRMVQHAYNIWNNQIIPELASHGIHIVDVDQLTGSEKEFLDNHFRQNIMPVLSPLTIDTTHPFPWLINKAVCVAAMLQTEEKSGDFRLGVVTIPRVLPRIIEIPSHDKRKFMFLTGVVASKLQELFRGHVIRGCCIFRITRNSNLYLNEEEVTDLLSALESELHKRKKGDAVRLEVRKGSPPELTGLLKNLFELDDNQVHEVDGPVNFYRVATLANFIDRPDLKYPAFVPREPEWMNAGENIFARIREDDLLLHHPYDSFSPVENFLAAAAEDPEVLAIKMTLYRTDPDSPLMDHLITAAANGKAVTVVVELKARFDEESNLNWAKHLSDNQVQVVYGMVGLKTHCKLLMVLRKEEKLRKYVHIGTGNYNVVTARLYTDLSLLTCRPDITDEVNDVFNMLTSQSTGIQFRKLLVSPVDMKKKFISLIRNEARHAEKGEPAEIIFKVNAVQDPDIIEALYRASQAGVRITGIVRGICCLKPGRKGYSENIRIISIVGRFLEHARIYHFLNAKPDRTFIGSADWMPRNLERRVEVVTPIRDPALENRILTEILDFQLRDNFDARISSSRFQKNPGGKRKGVRLFSSQQAFMDITLGKKNPGNVNL